MVGKRIWISWRRRCPIKNWDTFGPPIVRGVKTSNKDSKDSKKKEENSKDSKEEERFEERRFTLRSSASCTERAAADATSRCLRRCITEEDPSLRSDRHRSHPCWAQQLPCLREYRTCSSNNSKFHPEPCWRRRIRSRVRWDRECSRTYPLPCTRTLCRRRKYPWDFSNIQH